MSKLEPRNGFFFCLLVAALCLLSYASPYAQEEASEVGAGGKSLEEICKGKNLTVEQCQALKSEFLKTGGQVTPEVTEALKNSQDVKSDEAAKGKELSDGKGAIEERPNVAAKPATAVEENSLFERYISETSPLEVSTKLKPFGYNFFSAGTLPPPQNLPVASDYVVGPGDEIGILLWGRLSGQYSLAVSRDGTIQIPNIGSLSVAGMTFEDMKRFLTRQAKNIVGAEISVTMGRLRSIQVFVLGEVKKPGVYSVSAMSTITNALMMSGGPTQIGSLRKVELKRNGNETAALLDLYDLLLKGDKSKDKRLQNGDVVFVPTAGPLVGIAGNVKRPAIYELKGDADLSMVLELAGGIIPTAYTQQVQVERVELNEKRVVVDINTKGKDVSKEFKLQDADLVKIYSIVGKDENAVYLQGNVKRPGKYELKKGMRLKDLMKDETTLLPDTYFEYGHIKRLVTASLEVKLIPFNPGDLIFKDSQEDNIELAPQDSVYIFSKWSFKDKAAVSIEGEVRKKGQFDLTEDLTIKDLVLMAGGLTKDASMEHFELYRTDWRTKEAILQKFTLARAMEGDEAHNVKLQELDRVVIHSIWETTPKQYLTISGEVNRPGQYPYAANMTVKDLVFAAGNLMESAFMDEAELSSYTIQDGKSSSVSFRTIDLRRALSGDESQNILLKPYDSFLVRRITNWKEERYAELRGEVKFPGRYIVKKGELLSSVIERAGGYTDKAYLKGAVFTRESVRELQQKNLDDAIDRIENEMLSQSVISSQTALSSEDSAQEKAVAEQQKAVIAKMRAAKAQGRMVLKLDDMDRFKGGVYDIELEAGDLLTIPNYPNSIQIIGSVYNPTAFVYSPTDTISSYIGKAGGATRFAEDKDIFILKSDGSAFARRQSGMFFMSSRLDPGDTVVVPEKLERIAWMREVKDLTQILYQIAVTAGVLIVAF